jgi:beta-phosphoglucomutase-like phosphatase (HAD superfamily)
MPIKENKEETTAVTVVESKEVAQHIDTSISFEEHVKRFKYEIEASRKKNIKIIYEVGQFVNILKEQKAYGDKTVEAFVESMGDDAVNIKEVYKWGQFAAIYTVERVNELLEKSLSWGSISRLLRVKDDGARQMLEDKVSSGELPAGQLQDVVTALNQKLEGEEGDGGSDNTKGKEGKDPLPTNLCVAAFKKMNKLLENILTNTEPCAKDINDLSAIADNEDRYEKAVDKMDEFRALLPKVREALDKLEETLGKTI